MSYFIDGDESGSYSPLMLSYNKPGRQWTLNFQTKPEPRVILDGVEPTQSELLELMAQCQFPAILVYVMECIVGHLVREREGH